MVIAQPRNLLTGNPMGADADVVRWGLGGLSGREVGWLGGAGSTLTGRFLSLDLLLLLVQIVHVPRIAFRGHGPSARAATSGEHFVVTFSLGLDGGQSASVDRAGPAGSCLITCVRCTKKQRRGVNKKRHSSAP